jgi:hypothetical protein
LRGLDLNQRPQGYEPCELPGCSTPQKEYSKISGAQGQVSAARAEDKCYTLGVNDIEPGDEIRRIRKSMTRWVDMDAAGRLLGRGLGRRALMGRVALETGATLAAVQAALKR